MNWGFGETQGHHLSPKDFGEDPRGSSSTKHDRQERRAIPHGWISQQLTSKRASSPTHDGPKSLFPSSVSPFRSGRLDPITIRGLGSGVLQPLDFCIPVVRHYPADAQGHPGQGSVVQLMDLTTIWNGLQYAEAQELYRIHQVFTTTFERMLAGELWKIYYQQDELPYTTYDEGQETTSVLRGISFCRNQLVEEMTNSLDSSKDARLRDQLGLMRLYLAAIDCLVPHDSRYRDTSVTVRVYHNNKYYVHNPVVEAVWAPDSLLFKDLDGTPREGQEIFIVPQYHSNSAFGSKHCLSNIRYILESQQSLLSWLRWDNEIAGFRGVVPMRAEVRSKDRHSDNIVEFHRSFQKPFKNGNKLHIDVRAVLVDNNGGHVQYERVVRARITLQILPRHTSKVPYTDNQHQNTGSRIPDGSRGAGVVSHILPQPSRLEISEADHNIHSRPTDMGDRRHSNLLASEETRTFVFPNLVQKHTDLAARDTNTAQRHSDAEAHVRMPGSSSKPRYTGENELAVQGFSKGERDFPTRKHPSNNQSCIGHHFENSCSPQHAAESIDPPPSPRLMPVRQIQSAQHDCSATFSLPAPATRSFPSQTFDERTQAWSRTQVQEAITEIQSHVPSVSTNGSQHYHDLPSLLEAQSMRMQAELYFGSPSRLTYQGHPAGSSIPSLLRDSDGLHNSLQGPTLCPSDSHEPTAISERSGLRRARSSLSPTSLFKRAKEDEKDTSSSSSTPSMIPFRNYYSPLQDYESAITSPGSLCPISSFEEEARIPGQGSADSSRQDTLSATLSDIAHRNRPNFSLSTPSKQVGSSQGASNPSASSPRPIPVPTTPQGARIASPFSQEKLRNIRTVSMHSCLTTGDSSRAPSSSIQVIVEDPQACLSRSIQANKWSQLSNLGDSDKENQPETTLHEPRLSREEKMAFGNAVDRSLEEVTGNFDNIFLVDSDNSNSDDDINGN